jgi:hypothetical protein
MSDVKNLCKLLVGRPERDKPLGKYKNLWEDTIKMSVKEIQCKGIDWVSLAQERVKWQAVVHTVMNLQKPLKMEDFLMSLENMTFFKDSFTFRWLSLAAVFVVFISIFYFDVFIFCVFILYFLTH